MPIVCSLLLLWAVGCAHLGTSSHAQHKTTARYYKTTYDSVFLHALQTLGALDWLVTQQDHLNGLILAHIPAGALANAGSITIHVSAKGAAPPIKVSVMAASQGRIDFGQSRRNADAFLAALGQRLWATAEEKERLRQGTAGEPPQDKP